MEPILDKHDPKRLAQEAELSQAPDAVRILVSRAVAHLFTPLLANRGQGKLPHLGRILHNVDLPIGIWLRTERARNSINAVKRGTRDGLIAFAQEVRIHDPTSFATIPHGSLTGWIAADEDPIARHLMEQILVKLPHDATPPSPEDNWTWSEHC